MSKSTQQISKIFLNNNNAKEVEVFHERIGHFKFIRCVDLGRFYYKGFCQSTIA